jgi:hypothetical protein
MDDNLVWYRGRGRSMRMVRFSALAIVLTLAAACSGVRAEPWSADGLDKPFKKRVVDFGPSPYYPGGRVRIKLTCYFYAKVMVKQYDAGQKGAEWLAFTSLEKAGAPACDDSHGPGEKLIDREWNGYFRGVKGDLVFFDAADGMNLGLPFAVYDSVTGKKIFEDSAYDSRFENRKVAASPFNQMRVTAAGDGTVSLIYLRVVEAGCELHFQKASCWPQVKKKFELKSNQAPVCSRFKSVLPPAEPALAYPVEVSLSPKPTIKTIAGPVRCWPQD